MPSDAEHAFQRLPRWRQWLMYAAGPDVKDNWKTRYRIAQLEAENKWLREQRAKLEERMAVLSAEIEEAERGSIGPDGGAL